MSSTAPTSPPPPTTSPPPPTPSPAPPTGTVRRTGDRVVGGVAAALGRSWGIDPVLVRILFIVGTFAAGIGALLYLVLWISLPLVDAPPPPDSTVHRRGPAFWLGAAVVTIGGIIALAGLPARNIFVPLALVALGVALWQRPGTSDTAPGETPVHAVGTTPTTAQATTPATDQATAPTAATRATTNAAWQPPTVPGRGGSAVTDTAAWSAAPRSTAWRHVPEVRWWTPPAPRPRPSWLGPITVAVALVAAGVVALLGQADVLAPSGTDLLAVALLVLAGGLVVGAFVGRARWLALPALALSALLAVGGLGVPLQWLGDVNVGEQALAPVAIDDTLRVEHLVGVVTVDLSDTAIDQGDRVEVDVGAGEVRVLVPDDVDVQLTGDLRAGTVETVAPLVRDGTRDPDWPYLVAVLEDDDVPTRFVHRLAAADDPATAPTLFLDVSGGFAEVEVLRGVDRSRLLQGGGSRLDPPDDIGLDGAFVPSGWGPGDTWSWEAPATSGGSFDLRMDEGVDGGPDGGQDGGSVDVTVPGDAETDGGS